MATGWSSSRTRPDTIATGGGAVAETVAVNGDVLRWARETSGLDREEAAARSQQDAEALGRWEMGTEKPSVGALRSLAAAYRRPVTVLLLPHAPPTQEKPHDYRTIGGAAPRLGPEANLAIRRGRRLQELLRELVEESPDFWPEVAVPHLTVEADAESAAIAVRSLLRVPAEAHRGLQRTTQLVRYWRERLEVIGVASLVSRWPIEECRGVALWDPRVPMILLTESEGAEARLFSLLHDFAHLTLREASQCLGREDGSERGRVERWCNAFAGFALVPTELLRTERERLSKDTADLALVEGLAKRLHVSRQVVALRLEESALAPKGLYALTVSSLQPMKDEGADGGGRTGAKIAYARVGRRPVATLARAISSDLLSVREVSEILGVGGAHWEELRELAGGT